MQPLLITASTLVSALGRGLAPTFDALCQDRTGLSPCDFMDAHIDTWIGRVSGVEQIVLPSDLSIELSDGCCLSLSVTIK